MAGRVRQPIDLWALERWISKNVPQIEVPLDVKQVRPDSTAPATPQ
jgi:hypothetical protein